MATSILDSAQEFISPLSQHRSNSLIASILHELKEKVSIWSHDSRNLVEFSFKGVESPKMLLREIKRNVLLK